MAKTWSETVEEHGVKVRLYTRPGSKTIYREVRIGKKRNRKSLKHSNRKRAKKQAEALAKSIAELQLAGVVLGATLGQVFAAYERHRVPQLKKDARTRSDRLIALFTEAWGRDQLITDIGQHEVTDYTLRRTSGTLSPMSPETREDSRGKKRLVGRKPVKVKRSTVVRELEWLRTCFNWARRFKANGNRLIQENPLNDVEWPEEKNPLRPVASHERYTRTQEHTDTVDEKGRLRAILAVARYAGRRETAICELHASDVLLTRDAVVEALAASGMDERLADHMPHGAIRWRQDSDKMGFEFISPISQELREELVRYLQLSGRIGETPLFPRPTDDTKPMRKELAYDWLMKAERLAKLPKLKRGAFHPYRRLWASERKHLPDVDVAAAGGWRDLEAMKQSYQQSDPDTVLRVVELGG